MVECQYLYYIIFAGTCNGYTGTGYANWAILIFIIGKYNKLNSNCSQRSPPAVWHNRQIIINTDIICRQIRWKYMGIRFESILKMIVLQKCLEMFCNCHGNIAFLTENRSITAELAQCVPETFRKRPCLHFSISFIHYDYHPCAMSNGSVWMIF